MLNKEILVLFLLLSLPECKMKEEPHCSKYDFEEKVLEKMVRMEFQMEIMKSEMTKSVNTIEKLKEEITSEKLDGNLEELKKTLRGEVEKPTIAFKARLDADVSVSIGQTIVFPTVLFNAGDAYSTETGRFTAPVSGTYLFTAAFCMTYQKTLVAGLMVDGTKYTVTLLYGDANHECISADMIVVLVAGQKVWVEILPGGTSGAVIDEDNYRWNTFSGTLL